VYLLLRWTALILVVTAMLSGCEEVIPDETAAGSSLPEPENVSDAVVYRVMSPDELLERWNVFPGGGYAANSPAAASTRTASAGSSILRAAATDNFSGLPSEYVFIDAYEYGSCVTFTIRFGGTFDFGDEGIAEDYRYVHLLDCTGEPISGNEIQGLFHITTFCEFRYHGVVARAGDFTPNTRLVYHEQYSYDEDDLVRLTDAHLSVGGQIRHFSEARWSEAARVDVFVRNDEGIIVDRDWVEIPVKWANLPIEDRFGFSSIGSVDQMSYGIDTSHGTVRFQDNDTEALKEYERRCETQAPLIIDPGDPGEPAPPEPPEPPTPEPPPSTP